MISDEAMYVPEEQKSYKQMISEQQKQPSGPQAPGMIEKLVESIMAGKKPNPEEKYTNRGNF